MYSVTQRARQVKQPRGGFINPRLLSQTQHIDDHPSVLSTADENISPVNVGLAVDYLSRLASGTEPIDAFQVSLLGALRIGGRAKKIAGISVQSMTAGVVDETAVIAACTLTGFDVAKRAGAHQYNPAAETYPDEATVSHILVMVERVTKFFDEHGPVIADGFTFEGGYTEIISSGDGDLLTADTLWDLKVSKNPPTSQQTLQLMVYFLMGQRSEHDVFDGIKHIGIFNPRSNMSYRLRLTEVPESVKEAVASDVIGYR